jgi:hypothetical protein
MPTNCWLTSLRASRINLMSCSSRYLSHASSCFWLDQLMDRRLSRNCSKLSPPNAKILTSAIEVSFTGGSLPPTHSLLKKLYLAKDRSYPNRAIQSTQICWINLCRILVHYQRYITKNRLHSLRNLKTMPMLKRCWMSMVKC